MIIQKELYDAFIEAGVCRDLAERAASSLIERQNEMERDIFLLKWMVGTILGVCITILIILVKAFVM